MEEFDFRKNLITWHKKLYKLTMHKINTQKLFARKKLILAGRINLF